MRSTGYFFSCQYISHSWLIECSITYHHLFRVDKLKCMPFNSMEGCIWGISGMWRWRLGWGNFTPSTLRKLPTTYCHHTQNLNPKITKSVVDSSDKHYKDTKTFRVIHIKNEYSECYYIYTENSDGTELFPI